MSMPTRKIGKAEVSAVGFGAMGIGGFSYGANSKSFEERFVILDRAFELGCTFWDTANIYGDSEELIGAWFKKNPGKREKIFLATKFGYGLGTSTGGEITFDASPAAVKASCDRALKVLGVDKIDLFYAHRIDPKVPIELTVGAMAELVKEGKVTYLGLSECSTIALRRAQAIHPIAAVQVEYAPITLDIEDPKVGLLAACRELGVAVIPWSPLGRGVLTGQIKSPDEFAADDYRRYIPRFSKENFPRLLVVADKMKSIAEKHKATAGQVALAWVLAQGADFIPIPGTRNIKYLEENVGAAYVQLSAAEVAEIRKACEESGAGDTLRMLPNHLADSYQDSPPLEGYKA